jgi:glycosyltransferase involved in cell wall biosynthesis
VLGLRAAGHRAALVANPDSELYRRMLEGLDLVPLAPRREIDLAAAWKLSRVIRQLKPQLVHAHDPHAVAMTGMALSFSTPRPVTAAVASHRIEGTAVHNSYSRWAYDQIDCFIATCAALRDRLSAQGVPAHRIEVVHGGVDVERITRLPAANVHAELFLPTHAPIVGNVAALVARKGHHHLIEAAALVVRQVPDVRFVIVGDGDLRQALEDDIRHRHLERHVFLAAFRPDALELIKGFDVFASSALTEGFGTAIVEAMAAGKSAVATAVGGVPEVITDGKTGYLVPPHHAEAMATRLVTLLKDEALRRQMGAAAARIVRERFSVERMVEGTIRIYARLLGNL